MGQVFLRNNISPWKYKEGNLYVMTSNTTPAPFTATAGIYPGDAFKAFDNLSSGWQHPNGLTYATLMFNKDIKIVEISTVGQYYPIDILIKDGRWVNVKKIAVLVPNVVLDGKTVCNGIRIQTSGTSVLVTKWYEK